MGIQATRSHVKHGAAHASTLQINILLCSGDDLQADVTASLLDVLDNVSLFDSRHFTQRHRVVMSQIYSLLKAVE